MASQGPPSAVFRFDAGPDIGGGHAVRSLALADTLANAGWRCALMTNSEARKVVPAITRSGHQHHELTEAEDDIAALRALTSPNLLVVDHYGRDQAFESALRAWVPRIAVFDDIPNRPHDCDVLIDPTPGRTPESYSELTPETCTFALGPAHAILRAQFQNSRSSALARRGTSSIRRILISLGSVDAAGLTGPALDVVHKRLPDAAIDVVLGPAAPYLKAVQDQVKRLPDHIRLHIGVEDMAALMTSADLAIGAAGSSALERCAVGLPSIAIMVANNQQNIANALLNAKAAKVISLSAAIESHALEKAFDALVDDHAQRTGMAHAAATLCDGHGARRVMLALLVPSHANDNRPVTLRLAEPDDEARLLEWQHHPETRRHARNPALPTPEEHHSWFISRLVDPDCVLGIVECAQVPAGLLRLDRRSDGTEISILTDPDHKRLGIAKAALDLARRVLPADTLIAEALAENEASHALFRSAGFRQEAETTYSLDPKA